MSAYLYFDLCIFDAADGCQSSPCQYGATCNQLVDQYTCTCPYGFTGVNCESRTIINFTQQFMQ